jgi:hypothetical protein
MAINLFTMGIHGIRELRIKESEIAVLNGI